MGKATVVEFLLKNCNDVEKMIGVTDGQSKTGFMKACQWGRYDIVKLILNHQACLGKKDMYEGFKLACTHKKKSIICLIMKVDEFRSHIVEKEQANVTRSQCGKVIIRRQKSESRNETQDVFISFNEESSPLIIEVNSPKSTRAFITALVHSGIEDEGTLSYCNETDNARLEKETKQPRTIQKLFSSTVQLGRIRNAVPRESMIPMQTLTSTLNADTNNELAELLEESVVNKGWFL